MSTHSNKDYDGATEAPFYQLCTDCHDPHPTSNDALIRTSIGSLSVRLHAQSGADSYDDGFDDVEHDSICVVCHTATDHNKNTSTELRDDGHNPVGTDCIGCHPHGDEPSTRSGFMPTEGDCLACHSSAQAGRRQIVDDQQDGTGSGGDFIRGSHHVQPVTGTVTAADCVTCHDTSQHQGGSVRLIDPDDAGNVIVYTDGASVESFCVNCHDANGAAGNTTPFSDGKTVPPMPAGWASSAHKTSAGSPLTCLGDGTTGCHSNGHGSNLTPLLAPADGSPGPGNVNEEEGFCFACHDADGPASDDIESLFAKPSQHSVDGADGAQLECTNCHNPHNATDAAPLADPDSPAALWTGNERDFCLRCHDGAPPPAVVFPAAAPGTGWDKSATVGTTHDNNLSGMCTSCHEPHGVDYESLLLGRYDRVYQSYAPAEYGLCWNCHDEQAVVQNDNAFGNKHTRHVVNVESPCIFCHDTHVPYDAGESGLIDYGHAVDHAGDFLLSWGSHSYDLSSSFVDTGQNTGTCSLKCHGKPHNAVSYSGEEVTATLTATATPTGTPTNTSTPTATATNTATATATATNTATATATLTATTSPAATPTATATETPSPTSTSTPTPGTAEVSIDPPSQTVTGSTVSVDIAITDAADLGSYDIILTWDETLLSFLSVSNGSFLGSTGRTVNCPEPMTDTNIVSFSCSTTGADPGPNGNGLLATLQFSTISDGISPLTLSGVALTDTSGASLAVTTSDGTITVQSPTATSTPTPGDTPTVTATPTATTSPTPTPTATPTSTATATATATETPSPTPTTAAPTALPTATDENASDPGASHAGTLAVLGEAPGDSAGYALATGDINGDGKSDLIIGAPHADAGARDEAGKTYVIFGTTDLPPTVDLSRTTAGLVVSGPVSGGWSGFAVAAADLNGDGSDDLIIGAPGCWQCGSAANETYVIYGGGGLRSVIDLSSDSADVTIPGRALHDRSGSALATGDLNGDGTDDLIIGAPYAAAPAGLGAGATYVVFGGASLDSVMDLDASASFTVYGSSPNDHSASAVASGDFNGDGLDDLVVGAPGAATAGGAEAGEAYVIYGSPALSGTLDLNASRANVTITGGTAHELFGSTVAAGDVSADGRADLTIGAPGSDPAGRRDAGAVYVFREGSLLRDIDLGVTSADLVLMGDDDLDRAGHALAVGDASGDGISDLIVGASGADPTAGIGAGETYVIHGGSDLPSILDLASNPADLTVFGAQSGDSSGSALAAADINSDGLEDLVIGAPGAQPGGRHRAGAVYVVFSHWAARPTATPTATVTPTRTPVPTSTPTLEATSAPTSVPTRVATPSPTAIPAPQPTATATPSATAIPPSPPTAVSTPSPPGHARTSTASRSVYGGMSVAQWQVQEGAGELFFGQHLQVLLALLG